MGLSDRLLASAGLPEHSGVVDDLLGAVVPSRSEDPLQAPDDLWEVIVSEVRSTLGEEVAERVRLEISLGGAVPTSNHFGIDTFADSVQSTLLFGMTPLAGRPRSTVVFLGCSSISMNNLTYPMGLLLYDSCDTTVTRIPRRLALYGYRHRNVIVARAPAFDAAMVERALTRLDAWRVAGELSETGHRSASMVLTRFFARDDVLALDSYVEQALVVNRELATALHADASTMPDLAQLSLENVATQLLMVDLPTKTSLIARSLLNSQIRGSILANLDGQRGCWDLDSLRSSMRQGSGLRGGTVFFWLIGAGGKRLPLTIANVYGRASLCGYREDTDQAVEISLGADELIRALARGTIVPSMFTCYTALAFARGLICLGGYYQGGYLTTMRRAIVRALREHGRAEEAAKVEGIVVDAPLASLQPLARLSNDRDHLLPVGMVELVASGGLTPEQLSDIRRIPVRQAQRMGLVEAAPHTAGVALPDNWMDTLMRENVGDCPDVVRVRTL